MIAFPNSGKTYLDTTQKAWPLVIKYFAGARKAKREGRPVAWGLGWNQKEVLHAMGIPTIQLEMSFLPLEIQRVTKYLEMADASGYSLDSCSLGRALIGFVLSDDWEFIPKPDFIVGTSGPCYTVHKSFMEVAECLGVPYYLMDSPKMFQIGRTNEVLPHQVEYYVEQFREMIAFAENLTGLSLKEENLRRTCELAEEVNCLWSEIQELRKHSRCPMGLVDESVNVAPAIQLIGLEQIVPYYKELLEEVRIRVKNNTGNIENEHYRLLWLGNIPQYHLDLLNYFEEFGGVVVRSDVDYTFGGKGLDPSNALESLSRRMICSPLNGVVENQINQIRRLVKDYKIDGILTFTNLGCRQGVTRRRAIIDVLLKEFGIPSLVIDGDRMDIRNYASDQLKSNIEDFMEMLI